MEYRARRDREPDKEQYADVRVPIRKDQTATGELETKPDPECRNGQWHPLRPQSFDMFLGAFLGQIGQSSDKEISDHDQKADRGEGNPVLGHFCAPQVLDD